MFEATFWIGRTMVLLIAHSKKDLGRSVSKQPSEENNECLTPETDVTVVELELEDSSDSGRSSSHEAVLEHGSGEPSCQLAEVA